MTPQPSHRDHTSRRLARVTLVSLIRGMAMSAGTAITAWFITWLQSR